MSKLLTVAMATLAIGCRYSRGRDHPGLIYSRGFPHLGRGYSRGFPHPPA
jgi:hypothetical protein